MSVSRVEADRRVLVDRTTTKVSKSRKAPSRGVSSLQPRGNWNGLRKFRDSGLKKE